MVHHLFWIRISHGHGLVGWGWGMILGFHSQRSTLTEVSMATVCSGFVFHTGTVWSVGGDFNENPVRGAYREKGLSCE
jgi:hypothetical protein